LAALGDQSIVFRSNDAFAVQPYSLQGSHFTES
jgi:hypothetical protein